MVRWTPRLLLGNPTNPTNRSTPRVPSGLFGRRRWLASRPPPDQATSCPTNSDANGGPTTIVGPESPCSPLVVVLSVPLSLLRDPRLADGLLVLVRDQNVLLVPEPPADAQLSFADVLLVLPGRLVGSEVLCDSYEARVVGFVTPGELRVARESATGVLRYLRDLALREAYGLRWLSDFASRPSPLVPRGPEAAPRSDVMWFAQPGHECGCLP